VNSVVEIVVAAAAAEADDQAAVDLVVDAADAAETTKIFQA
jgi:hypothetical protein